MCRRGGVRGCVSQRGLQAAGHADRRESRRQHGDASLCLCSHLFSSFLSFSENAVFNLPPLRFNTPSRNSFDLEMGKRPFRPSALLRVRPLLPLHRAAACSLATLHHWLYLHPGLLSSNSLRLRLRRILKIDRAHSHLHPLSGRRIPAAPL